MSLRAYATRRKRAGLRGGSAEAVSKAISTGRLREAVVLVGGVPKIRDPDLADREWAASTDTTTAPIAVQPRPPPAPPPPPPPPPAPAPVPAAASAAAPPKPARPRPPLGAPPPQAPERRDFVLAEELAAEKHWKALHAELEYRERAGELVEAAEVQRVLTDVFAEVRAKLLGVPTRARQALPHLTTPDVGAIEGMIREALEALADGAAAKLAEEICA